MDALLHCRGITKRFPGVVALDSVDFALAAGEVHALMGENGAGKSTLVKVMTGLYRPDAGIMELQGVPYSPRAPHHAQELGVSTVYQEVNLVPNLSVAENVCLGRGSGARPWIRWKEMRGQAEKALQRVGLEIDTRQSLGSLSIAFQQMVAIARALDLDARILVLDEPTSSLDRHETEQLFTVVRDLRSKGLGIVFVTHFLDQVFELSDRVSILRNGSCVGTRSTAGLTKLELVSLMIGRSGESILSARKGERSRHAEEGAVVLKTEGLGRKGEVEGLSLTVRKGEVVGLAGLLGSGRTESLRLVFGADKATQGSLVFDGRPRRRWGTRRAVRAGMGLCPEDRKVEAIFPNLSVEENLAIVVQTKRGLRPLSRRRVRSITEHAFTAMQIKAPGAKAVVKNLSGGNQQKVVLARWLASDPSLLLLDEPTRGIDVGARFEVAGLIESLASKGLAVVVVSSELDETVQLSDRVYVLRDRALSCELSAESIDEPTILKAIAGDST